ncbi:thioredoxin [Lactobacillus selangorensis]|uniref:thioredoxin n=1 Tax=Lactobacillus selangorensis TaxID=81857 RepID=UPI000710C4B6|nr:thioredoxin [Lactobacillus selangorensis]
MTIKVTAANFNDVTADGLVVVDFWAEWCPPCKMMAPILEELDTAYGDRLTIAKLNVDHNQNIAEQYGIQSIPTLLVFKNGKASEKVTGFYPKTKLQTYFDQKIAEMTTVEE